jgi:hypothetical protein
MVIDSLRNCALGCAAAQVASCNPVAQLTTPKGSTIVLVAPHLLSVPAMLKPLLLAAASSMIVACMPVQRDYQTARIFQPTYESMDMRVKLAITSAEGADAEFQGSLSGVNEKLAQADGYASVMGRYGAVKSRLEADKAKWQALQAWARSITQDPVKADLDRLNTEGNALQLDLGNIDGALRQMPGELARVRMTAR